jgi:NADP-dependent aldehyde dehydrogenase
MASINPVVFFPGALEKDSAVWAKQYSGSITLGSGQFCTNPRLLLGISGKPLEDFISSLSSEILEIAPQSMLHPNIKNAYDRGKNEASSQDQTSVVAAYKEEVDANYGQQVILRVSGTTFLKNPTLHQEVFGPFALIVECRDQQELKQVISGLEGQLTGTLVATTQELEESVAVVRALQGRVGRLIFNSVPTGVEVTHAMQHGGPYPATSDARFTSVGTHAIYRWVRPVSYQDFPKSLLPDALKDENPLAIMRIVNGQTTDASL